MNPAPGIFRFELLPTLTAFAVGAASFLFALVFLRKSNPRSEPVQSKKAVSIFGFSIQGSGYALVWILHRPFFTPLVPGIVPDWAVCVAATVTGAGSVWIFWWALRTLGCEWSLSARLVAGHRLVTAGPYRFVRHPIYVAMFGMLFCTWLAVGQPGAVIATVPVFLVGTFLRIRTEEALLAEAFGTEWIRYKEHVGGLIPTLRGLKGKGQSANQRETRR